MTEPFLLLPRGIRNNNPGNIRRGKARWSGMLEPDPDPDFVTFTTPVMGLRALMRLLLNYHRKYGLDSVESILNRFAPPHENATDHYIIAVCRYLRIGRREPLALEHPEILVGLARAIVGHENGLPPEDREWYPDTLYKEAAVLALEKGNP